MSYSQHQDSALLYMYEDENYKLHSSITVKPECIATKFQWLNL